VNGRELKQHERFKREAQFLRSENQHLHRELDTYRPAWHWASVRIDKLEQQVKTLEAEKKTLLQKVKDLTLDRIFVGQGSGRNQQRRRAGAATGGGGPQNQRRKPEQKRRKGLGDSGLTDEDRNTAKPKVDGHDSIDAGGRLVQPTSADHADGTMILRSDGKQLPRFISPSDLAARSRWKPTPPEELFSEQNSHRVAHCWAAFQM